MSGETCRTCLHFIQHYALDRSKFLRVYCGHCTFSTPKHKRPDTKACENYIQAPLDTEAFATKEYLSKQLLKYMLSLELLPEIEDAPVVSELRGKRKKRTAN